MKDITVVIVAHNAATTIERALVSVLADCDAPILLVDDFSTDDTAAVAAQVGGARVTVIQPAKHLGVGNARQTALEAIQTPYGIWLDSDDEVMPGRVARHLELLASGNAQIVYDAGELVSGETGAVIKPLEMPAFLAHGAKIGRMVERNWLPLLHCSFDVVFARTVGFDTSFKAAEDYDFLLRALMAGGQVSLIDAPGYRYYHYEVSLSRALGTSVRFFETAQGKHEAGALEAMLRQGSALSEAEVLYSMAAWAVSRRDAAAAVPYLTALQGTPDIVEPYGKTGAELATYLQGSANLLTGSFATARDLLAPLHAAWPSPAVANNLGVALWQLGEIGAAETLWREALQVSPGYYDAEANLMLEPSGTPRVTLLPLRPLASRSSYANGAA